MAENYTYFVPTMAGIYIHIPFCKRRCLYCDFYSNTDMTLVQSYVDALTQELSLRASELQGEVIESIYLGGGTPTQLERKHFQQLFVCITQLFTLSPLAEITLEGNPDDLTDSYLTTLQGLPFNRISMGVQSFDDRDLKFLNRRHTASEAIACVERCKESGYSNLSIDLIYGLPNQTMAGWIENVAQAIALDVPHISAYSLIYEQGTALYKMWKRGKVKACDEDLVVEMFHRLVRELRKEGYEHYEISNYAKQGAYARHNTAYWQGIPYLGIGAAAHSYTGGRRICNVAHIERYIAGIEQGTPDREVETLTPTDRYNDLIVTSLRTMWGLSLAEVERGFGSDRLAYTLEMASPYIVRNLLLNDGNRLRLSEEGVFLSDGIIADLLYLDDDE